MTISPLANYTILTEHCGERGGAAIDTVTIHCLVGQATAKEIGQYFRDTMNRLVVTTVSAKMEILFVAYRKSGEVGVVQTAQTTHVLLQSRLQAIKLNRMLLRKRRIIPLYLYLWIFANVTVLMGCDG